MASGDPVGAARLWGKMTAAHPPFEDIALRLVDSGSPDALHILLSTKLDALPSSDRAQVGIELSRLLLHVLQVPAASSLTAGQ